MRDVYTIRRDNAEREKRERSGDFADEKGMHIHQEVPKGIQRAHDQGGPKPEYLINRCKACDEPAEDCCCERRTYADGYLSGLDRAIELLENNGHGVIARTFLVKERSNHDGS